MKYPLLGSALNGIRPEALSERGFGVAGLFHRSPPLGDWVDMGEPALHEFLEPIRDNRMRLSWHYPVLYPPRDGRHPEHPGWFATDAAVRQDEQQRFELDAEAAARQGADHLVAHFTYHPSVQPPDQIDPLLVTETLEWMAEVQQRHGVAICLECFGDPYWLAVRAARYGLYLCLDTGHLARSSHERRSRILDDASTMAPLVRVIHLWNTRHLSGESHVAYHPDQRPADGWTPILAVLDRVLQYRPSTPIVAEASLPLHGFDRFWDGMTWLGDRLNTRK